MLLKEGRSMKKRKEKKQMGEKVNGKTSISASSPNPDSNSSYLTDVDPSEIEVLEVKDFEYQSDEDRPALPHNTEKKRKHRKKKKKKKAQGEGVSPNPTPSPDVNEAHVHILTGKSKKKATAIQNGSGGHHAERSAPTSKDVPSQNLGSQKPKKKKKKKNGYSSMNAADVKGSKKSKLQRNSAPTVDPIRQKETGTAIESVKDPASSGKSLASQVETIGRKRKIENIFEEAEMCMEEAVPRKIDEAKKMLRGKGATAAGPKGKVTQKESSRERKMADYEDLSFKKARVDVDASLEETTEKGISSGLTNATQKILEKVDKTAIPRETKLPDIDPNKFIPVKTQKLRTAMPEFEEAGDSESEEEEEEQRMNLMEAFADDDIADEFRKEKDEAEQETKPTTVDLRLPGWGSWGGLGINPEDRKRRKSWNKLLVKFPGVPRRDQGRKNVIINDDPPASFRKQQVDDLPSEFPSVAAYEAAIRAPIGNTWVPEVAHKALIAPPVITRMGSIIQPLDESHLIKEDAEQEAQKKFNDSVKAGKPAKGFKSKSGKPAGPRGKNLKKNFKPAKKSKVGGK